MNTNNTAAPSVTIAPRNPAKGVLNLVVTLTHLLRTSAFDLRISRLRRAPCRSMESAIKLAERFIAGVIKPRPAAPQPETTPAPVAEPVAA